MSYVTTSSGQFRLDAARFRFLSINCYPLVQNDTSTADLDDFFNYCNQDSISVVRIWCFNKTVPATSATGNFRYNNGGVLTWVEATFVSLDRALDSAKRHGVRVMLPIVDNNGNNKHDYLTWNDAINGTLYTSSPAKSVSSLTQTGNVATCTTSTAHGFATDDRISVTGANETDYNLNRWITVTGGTTFTYPVSNSPSTPATGTITATRPAGDWYFYTDSNVIQMYKDFVDKLSARVNTINGRTYSSDDTIFSIELGNELRYDKNNDPAINTINSKNFIALGKSGGWADTLSAYIKTKFPNHLVGYGDLGHTWNFVNGDSVYNGSFYGLDYTLTGALTGIDYYDFHLYPYDGSYNLQVYGQNLGYANASSEDGLLNQIRSFVTIAKANNKPCIVGEWGLDKRNTVFDKLIAYTRDMHFNKVFKTFFDAGGDGFSLWHYATSGILDDNNYNIKPNGVHTGGNANSNSNDDDTSLRSIIAQHSYRLRGKRIPIGVVNNVSI